MKVIFLNTGKLIESIVSRLTIKELQKEVFRIGHL